MTELIDKRSAKKSTRDILVIVVITILISCLSLFFDLSERFYQWSRLWETYQVDELLFPLLSFSICLIWFGWRRYKDSALESRESSRLLLENRQLIRKLTLTQERERLMLAQELHDVFAQYLTALRAHAEIIQVTTAETDNQVLIYNAQKVIVTVDKLHEITRVLLKTLRPPLLRFGITLAVKGLLSDWKETHPTVQCKLNFHGGEPDFNEEEMLAIYRTLQEGLSNIAKHTDARQVEVNLYFPSGKHEEPALVVLHVVNDGVENFELPIKSDGLGLVGIRERATMLDGTFELSPHAPSGTILKFSFPIRYQKVT